MAISIGERFGRFEILGRLGAGGMGSVYRARDDELDRDVAIKVLDLEVDSTGLEPSATLNLRDASPVESHRTDVLDDNDSGSDSDLIAEARAMARLSHPNVVSVFELGSDNGRVFVAMELVEGADMRAWLAASKRSVDEIVRVFSQAARGLAAAHDAGLVHRDFKPDNVLIGDDGRVLVSDFGLAFAARGSGMVRVAHGIAGTPGYMAPELADGDEPSAATDVYAFCVSMLEALLGQTPDEDPVARSAAVANLVGVPARVRRCLRAGLAIDPSKRPADGAALVDSLRKPGRSRALIGAAVASAVAGAAIAFAATGTSSQDACKASWPRLDEAWSGKTSEQIRANFEAVGSAIAADSAPRVVSILEARAKRMRLIREETCVAAKNGDIDRAVRAARDRCLDDALVGFEAVVDAVSVTLSLAEVSRAVSLADVRDELACSQSSLASTSTASPELDALRRDFEALVAAIRLESPVKPERIEELEALLARDAASLDETLYARMIYRKASTLRRLARHEEAKLVLREAIVAATAAKDDRLAARATIALASVVANRLRDVEEGETLIRVAESAISRVPDAHEIHATFHRTVARARRDRSDYDGALEALAEAEAALAKIASPSPALLDLTLFERGAINVSLGNFSEAHEIFTKVLEARRRDFGSNHPRVANPLSVIGYLLTELDRPEEGLAKLEEAIKIYRESNLDPNALLESIHRKGVALDALGKPRQAREVFRQVLAERQKGPKSVRAQIASSHFHIAQSSFLLGDYDVADEHFRKQVELYRDQFGEQYRGVATGLRGRARVAHERGEFDKAASFYNQAREIRVAIYGPEHRYVVRLDGDLGRLELSRGNFDKALTLLRQVMSRLEASGKGGTGSYRVAIGKCLLELGKPEEAREELERAIAELVQPADEPRRAVGRFELARALDELGDSDAARELARKALAALEGRERFRERIAEIEKWLAARSR